MTRKKYTAKQQFYSDQVTEKLYDEFFGEKIREAEEMEFFSILLKDCDRFLDIGANIGQYTYFANTVLKDAEIVSIEANPYLIPIIEDVIAKAEKRSQNNNNIRIVNVAVVEKKKKLKFYLTDYIPESSIFNNVPGSIEVVVEGRPLDYFYRPSKKTLVKMDIEGAEYRAVKSAKKFLASDHTTFFLELHGWGDRDLRKYPLQVATLFFKNGYGVKKIGSHYLFERADKIKRVFGFLANFPLLSTKWLIYRYMSGLVPWMRVIRGVFR